MTLYAITSLVIVMINGDHFIIGGRKGSGVGKIRTQFIRAPPMTAPPLKNIIGDVVLVSSSEVN